MTKADTYNVQAKKTRTIDLPEDVFALPWNDSLMHQVVVSMQANMRTPVAHTKDRGDVRGGGRKPWKQKGTGRARHGSVRSPLWKGGGVTFGPRNEKDYSKVINKKMRAKALFVALSRKFREEEILFVDEVSFDVPSTAEARKVVVALASIKGFEGMATKKKNNILVVTAGNDKVLAKSFNNFGNVEVDDVRNLNPMDVLKYKHLVVVSPKESVSFLEGRAKAKLGAGKNTEKTTAKKISSEKVTKQTTKKKATEKVATKK